jgi:hypothetical protein
MCGEAFALVLTAVCKPAVNVMRPGPGYRHGLGGNDGF